MAKTLSDLVNVDKAGISTMFKLGKIGRVEGFDLVRAKPSPRLRKPAALPKVGKVGAVAGHTHPHANLGKYLHPKGGK